MRKEYSYEKIRNHYYPMVPVLLSYGDTKVDTFALIDSGSMVSLFQESVAKQLGLFVKAGKPKTIEGVGGRILVYIHNILIKVGDKEFNCEMAFSEEYKASFNILARKDFFENFRVIFEEKNKKLVLEEGG